jgi:hypothetical protein
MFDNVLAQGPAEPATPTPTLGPAHVALGVLSAAAGVGALLCAVLVDWGWNILLAWPVSFALGVAQLVLAWRAWRWAELGPAEAGATRWAVLALAAAGLLLHVAAFLWASFHTHGG